jgi:hypothetical protein
MPKFSAEEHHREDVETALHDGGATHLRVRRRGDTLTIESGPKSDAYAHARLKRVAVSLWIIQMPARHAWQPTPFRGRLPELLSILLTELSPWLASVD